MARHGSGWKGHKRFSRLLSRSRAWRISLAAALALLAALPLSGVIGLAWIQAEGRAEAADEAGLVETTTMQLVDMIALRFMFSTERIHSESVLAAGELGIEVDLIEQVLQWDISDQLSAIRPRLDEQLARTGDAAFRADLVVRMAQVRQNVDGGEDARPEVSAAFEHFENVTNDEIEKGLTRLERQIANLDDAADPAQALLALQAAYEVHRHTLGSIHVFGSLYLTDASAEARVALIERQATIAANRELLERTLSPHLRDEWQRVIDDPVGSEFDAALRGVLTGYETRQLISTDLDELGEIFRGGILRSEAMLEMFELVADDLVEIVGELKAEAETDYRQTLILVTAIGLVTIGAAAVLVKSLAGPLGQLGARAERLREGDLQPRTDSARGPREISLVSDAFDEAVASLRRFEDQADALAKGDLDHAVLNEPLPGRLGEALHASIRRLSESIRDRERLQRRLSHEASHDSLTGLPNRDAAVGELKSLLALGPAGARVALLFIDLDGFKMVNDVHGHIVGDEFLRVTADRLRRVLGDAMIARLGGDEFVVILRHGDGTSVSHLAEQILAELARPATIDRVEIRGGGASIGVAFGSCGEDDAIEMLKSADIAVYEAKTRSNQSVVVFGEALRHRSEVRSRVERELPDAISSNDLVVLYQPIVDAASRELVSVEALVRWSHPERGLLAPSEFIDVAEATGLIAEVDRSVLRSVLLDVAEWRQGGLLAELSVAVNVSRRQLLSPEFVDDIKESIGAAGVDPSALTLEISERLLLNDLAGAADRLAELRELGVRIAIDDFGAGHTSIGHLRLPVDIVKVDQSIVRSLDTEREMTLMTMFGEVASRLGLEMVAEGVESEAMLQAVTEVGCRFVQGFLIARPMDARALFAWEAERSFPTNKVALV